MPWKPKDAHRHKKGLSDKQARQWAHVANSALASCLADKVKRDICEASAVRQANSAVGSPKEKASVISDNITGNLIHGSGGILNPMRDGNRCECPKCGKKSSGKKPCAKRECPKCKAKLRKAKEGKKVVEKSGDLSKEQEIEAIRDAFHEMFSPQESQPVLASSPNSFWVRDMFDDHIIVRGNKKFYKVGYKRTKESIEFDPFLEWVEVEQEWTESKLKVYKTASGDWRWLTISNVAILDKEDEIVSEKAYDDAIVWAEANGAFGELDCLHVVDTDVGDCDFMARLGDQLVEGGLWRGDMRSSRTRLKVQDDPDYWGVSIKFKYDPEQFDGKVYKGGIRIPKRTILPRHMAASYGTAIAVTGGETMKAIDEETKVALTELGFTEDEVAELAERQKSLPPEEENVVEKGDETEVAEEDETEVTEKQGGWNKIRKLIEDALDKVKTPEPETVKSDTAELPKANTEVEPTNEEVQEMVEKRFAEFSQVVAKAVGEQVAVLTLAIEKVESGQQAIEARLAEAEKFVEDKVLERLAELPPVVKVRLTEVSATAVEPITPATQAVKSAQGVLMDDIATEVKRKTSTAQYEV